MKEKFKSNISVMWSIWSAQRSHEARLVATEQVQDVFILTQACGTPVGLASMLCSPIEWVMLNSPQEEVYC